MNEGIYTYKGIPYAQATRRFVPAGDISWEGIFDATAYGPISLQQSMGFTMYSDGSGNATLDNNCQNLNIWTPSINDGGKRAVMVWLHGGAFTSGASSTDITYDGANLSEFGDVVVVSVNHRLNLVGYLDLSEYGEEYRYSGNVGQMDIIMALEWIRENIEAFGGDPDNVTIFGESGGGAKVLALMATPSAEGLFHKAIDEMTEDEVLESLEETYGDQAQAFLAEFREAYPNEYDGHALYVDTMIRQPSIKVMEHKVAQGGASVYAYVFSWEASGQQLSNHMTEIPMVFHNAEYSATAGTGEKALAMEARMAQAWVNFAKTGDPSTDELAWPAYDSENRATMVFDNESYVAYNHTMDEMRREIPIMAWYPLGHGDSGLLSEPVFADLGQKYGKTPAQIVLRWHIQKGNIVIPGSKNPDHIRENFQIFDFTLTDAEMAEIAKLDGTKKFFKMPAPMALAMPLMKMDFDAQK